VREFGLMVVSWIGVMVREAWYDGDVEVMMILAMKKEMMMMVMMMMMMMMRR
jgi:hypothetical protein